MTIRTQLKMVGAVSIAGLALSANGIAQSTGQTATKGAEDTYTLSVNAQVVTVPVTVRDSKGKLLQDLTKDDFRLLEDGKPQAIRYVTIDRNRPLTLGLLVD